jgi:hypothetical protein
MTIKSHYKMIRARNPYYTARDALATVRRHENVTLADYRAKLAAWEAEPDKRRYAAGGYANRPKMPTLFSSRQPLPVSDWRDAGSAEEILSLRHSGYYRDTFHSETYAGHVWQLPARNGEPQFVAGYVDACAAHVVFVERNGQPEIFDSAMDAARAADSLAESDAEDEREHDEKWHEASKANDDRNEAREELKAARKRASVAVALLRYDAETYSDARDALAYARDEMREAITTIRNTSKRIADLDITGEFGA